MITPNKEDLFVSLNELIVRLGHAVQSALDSQRWELNRIENRLAMRSPQTRIRSDRQRLDELSYRISIALAHRLQLQQAQLSGTTKRLASLNPTTILQRGYAMVTLPDGQVVKSVNQVKSGDGLNIRVSDGQFEAQATERFTTS